MIIRKRPWWENDCHKCSYTINEYTQPICRAIVIRRSRWWYTKYIFVNYTKLMENDYSWRSSRHMLVLAHNLFSSYQWNYWNKLLLSVLARGYFGSCKIPISPNYTSFIQLNLWISGVAVRTTMDATITNQYCAVLSRLNDQVYKTLF